MNNENDGTKPYNIKRGSQKDKNVIPYNNSVSNDPYISVFVLCHEDNVDDVKGMIKKLSNKKITFTRGLDTTELSYVDKNNLLNHFDYMVVMVSESLFKKTELLETIVANYTIHGENEKIIPMVIWEELYEPEYKAGVIKEYQQRIAKYKENFWDDNSICFHADQLHKMQQVLVMLTDFLIFATDKDKKTDLNLAEKLLKYIKYHRKIPVADKENVRNNTKTIVNNTTFHVEDGGQLNFAMDNASINLKEK